MNLSYPLLNNSSPTPAPIELQGPGPIISRLQVCFLISEIRGLDYRNAQCPPLWHYKSLYPFSSEIYGSKGPSGPTEDWKEMSIVKGTG